MNLDIVFENIMDTLGEIHGEKISESLSYVFHDSIEYFDGDVEYWSLSSEGDKLNFDQLMDKVLNVLSDLDVNMLAVVYKHNNIFL